MIPFGATLRAAREARGLTYIQLAERTHLMAQQIEAIENEDFSRIAAPIYGRGFVKILCEAVGLDPKPLVDEFMEIYTGKRPPAPRPPKPQPPPEPPAAPAAQPVPDTPAPPPAEPTTPTPDIPTPPPVEQPAVPAPDIPTPPPVEPPASIQAQPVQPAVEELRQPAAKPETIPESTPASKQTPPSESPTDFKLESDVIPKRSDGYRTVFPSEIDDLPEPPTATNRSVLNPFAKRNAGGNNRSIYAKQLNLDNDDFDDDLDDGFHVPTAFWRILALGAAAVFIFWILFIGVRALYRATMTEPTAPSAETSAAATENPPSGTKPASSQPAARSDKGTPSRVRNVTPIAPLYID